MCTKLILSQKVLCISWWRSTGLSVVVLDLYAFVISIFVPIQTWSNHIFLSSLFPVTCVKNGDIISSWRVSNFTRTLELITCQAFVDNIIQFQTKWQEWIKPRGRYSYTDENCFVLLFFLQADLCPYHTCTSGSRIVLHAPAEILDAEVIALSWRWSIFIP